MNDRRTTPGTARSLALGDTTIDYLPDGAVQLVPRGWFPGAAEAVWSENAEWLDPAGCLTAGIGALLIRRDNRAMLIDTGFGPRHLPAATTIAPLGDLTGGALPDSLRALGVSPADIDTIALTHLHEDHTGWASLFPHAQFVAAAAEWGPARPARAVGAAEGDEIFPGVRLLELPGHTPGHAGYVVTTTEGTLLAFGDALHSPLQITHPEWGAASDVQPEQAARSRERVLAELRAPGTIGFGNHFADLVFGRITDPPGKPPRWTPVT